MKVTQIAESLSKCWYNFVTDLIQRKFIQLFFFSLIITDNVK